VSARLEESTSALTSCREQRCPEPRKLHSLACTTRLQSTLLYLILCLARFGSDAQVAVKAETDFGQKSSALRAEAEILISLQGGPGVPDVYWVGKRELAGQPCNILVMELLGPDMEDLLEMMNRRTVSEKTGLMLAWQFIDCLEHIHSRGLIHRSPWHPRSLTDLVLLLPCSWQMVCRRNTLAATARVGVAARVGG
jgi:hypothetical protein